MSVAIVVQGLTKIYNEIQALRGANFTVDVGETFGLIGPNGAGKTTTLRIVSTLLKPTSGTVQIHGIDISKKPEEVRKIISYLPEEAGAYKNLSGREYLTFMAQFHAKDHKTLRDMVSSGISVAGLGERIDSYIKEYSKGMKRRLLVARALMNSPRVAILDEPTSGLDINHAYYVRNIIKEYAKKGTTVLLSSHNMLEVEHVCDRVALINKGKVIEIDAPRTLIEKYNVKNLEEVFMGATKNAQ
jgi:ABC-2 type transport system ATP-binding protein